MKAWLERPTEEAFLLNPAFCCVVLTACIQSYEATAKKGLPFVLIFLVLPILLHKPTRNSLPHDTRTSMPVWLQENSIAKVMFYERLVSLKPYVREAIWFGMRVNTLFLAQGAAFQTNLKKADIDKQLRTLTDDARECVMRARFLGKWLATTGTPNTVMSLWGIRL